MKWIRKVFKVRRGFTLIEMLVVISIISILMVIAVTSMIRIKARSRDSQRKTDLATMRVELEKFYSVYKVYPYPTMQEYPVSATGIDCNHIVAGTSSGFAAVNLCLKEEGMTTMTLKDPGGFTYRYGVLDDRTSYEVSAKLESTGDSALSSDCTLTGTNHCDNNRYEVGTNVEGVDTSDDLDVSGVHKFCFSYNPVSPYNCTAPYNSE